jgi:hypothetical protein
LALAVEDAKAKAISATLKAVYASRDVEKGKSVTASKTEKDAYDKAVTDTATKEKAYNATVKDKNEKTDIFNRLTRDHKAESDSTKKAALKSELDKAKNAMDTAVTKVGTDKKAWDDEKAKIKAKETAYNTKKAAEDIKADDLVFAEYKKVLFGTPKDGAKAAVDGIDDLKQKSQVAFDKAELELVTAENKLAGNKKAGDTQSLTDDLKTKAEAFLTAQVDLAKLNDAYKTLKADYDKLKKEKDGRATAAHTKAINDFKKALSPLRAAFQKADVAQKAYVAKETELKATKSTVDGNSASTTAQKDKAAKDLSDHQATKTAIDKSATDTKKAMTD